MIAAPSAALRSIGAGERVESAKDAYLRTSSVLAEVNTPAQKAKAVLRVSL
jgi:hypothetical protein